MPVTTYTLLEGEILSENRNGTQRQYVPDPQGNTVALLASDTSIAKAFSYWSYGDIQYGDTDATKYLYGGTYGGRRQWDGGVYLRARVVDPEEGRWMTVDSLWPLQHAYLYCLANPASFIDLTGLYCGGQGRKPKADFITNKVCREMCAALYKAGGNHIELCKDLCSKIGSNAKHQLWCNAVWAKIKHCLRHGGCGKNWVEILFALYNAAGCPEKELPS